MEFGDLIYYFGLFLFTLGMGWTFGYFHCMLDNEEKKKREE